MEVEPGFDGQQAASAEGEAVPAQQAISAGQAVAAAESDMPKQPHRAAAAAKGRSKKQAKVCSTFGLDWVDCVCFGVCFGLNSNG